MATTYDKASLVMIPSGYKDDKLYSIKPTDGSGDFTFSRDGSGASPATRVNASGLIEKGRTNELLQSNQFDTTWGLSSGISVTGGQSGYDGSNDAWLLKRVDTSARYINQNITLSNAVYSYSVYAKAESVDWLYMWSFNGTGSVSVYFDLANGLVGTQSGTIDANIESVGGGWYRCSMSYNNNIAAVRLYPGVADGSITGGISPAGLYIQDAQLESGLVATDYIETTTTAVSAGLLGDMPRLDYSGGASCPSLLLEPSRTNLFPNSEYLIGGGWSYAGTGTSSQPNAAISPEGVQNAFKLIGSSNNDNNGIYETETINAGVESYSVFAKAGEIDILQIGLGGTFGSTYANVNLTDGSLEVESGQTTTIEPLANDWYRISCVATATAGVGYWFVNIGDDPAMVRNGNYIGNGTDGLYLYGFQTEYGSYPTSYIPTYGSASLRATEISNITSASALIGSEGVLFIEVKGLSNGGPSRRVSLSDGSNNNRVMIEIDETNNQIKGFVSISGTTTGITANGYDHTINNKMALKYTSTSIDLFINGVNADNDTLSGSPTGMDNINLYQASSSARWMEGNVKQFLVFNSALTDAEAIALTTI